MGPDAGQLYAMKVLKKASLKGNLLSGMQNDSLLGQRRFYDLDLGDLCESSRAKEAFFWKVNKPYLQLYSSVVREDLKCSVNSPRVERSVEVTFS